MKEKTVVKFVEDEGALNESTELYGGSFDLRFEETDAADVMTAILGGKIDADLEGIKKLKDGGVLISYLPEQPYYVKSFADIYKWSEIIEDIIYLSMERHDVYNFTLTLNIFMAEV